MFIQEATGVWHIKEEEDERVLSITNICQIHNCDNIILAEIQCIIILIAEV